MSDPKHQHVGQRPPGADGVRNGSPGPGANRLLDLLASSPGGCSDALLIAHGFTGAVLSDLLKAGLATTDCEETPTDGSDLAMRQIKITEAGRRALMWAPAPPRSRARVGAPP